MDGKSLLLKISLGCMLGFYFPGARAPDQRPPQTRTILNSLSSLGKKNNRGGEPLVNYPISLYALHCTNPQSTTTVHYHGVPRCTTTPLLRVPRPPRLAGRLARDPEFAEWAWGKIQISRNEGVGAKSRFRGMRRHPEYRNRRSKSAPRGPQKSTLFNFPNFYDARCCRSCCQNSLKPQRSNTGGIQKNAEPRRRPSVVFWEAERHPKNHRGAPAGMILLPSW